MKDDDTAADPEPTSHTLTGAPKPDPRKNQGQRRRVEFEEWEAIYQAWKAGDRSARSLGKRFNVSEDSAFRYIRKGLAVRGWPSFFARLQTEQQTVEEAKRAAAEKMAAQIVDEYGQVRKETLTMYRGYRGLISKVVAKHIEKIDGMAMTRPLNVHDVILDKDGVPHETHKTIERPLDSTEISRNLRTMAGALVLISRTEEMWLGGPTEPASNIPDEQKFSQDEIKFIEEHDGELPPGMTPESMLAKMAATYGIKLTGGAN